ncbi:O-antigen ligase family protein [Maribacter cobaltidurans]|nr:O-antigen ligase family protein [Maribacter cobaltidurans]
MVITFTTQSRAGLLLVILINLSFWLFINKPKKLSKLKSLGRKFLIGLALVLFALQFINIYQGSRIQQRVSQTDTKKDPRELLVKEGLEVFSENPIIGVGLGQFPLYSKYGLFTHNSYTEILAEQGIVGGILLLILYLIPTLQSFRNYRNDPENPFFKFYLTFFIIFLLYNNAYVFYKFPFSMMYFFLIISLQKRCTTYFNRKGLNIN